MKSYLLALVALTTLGIYYPCYAQNVASAIPKSNEKPLVIEKDQKSSSVTVNDTPLVIKGHIEGDVTANNSVVTIDPTGSVSGAIHLHKGALLNLSDKPQIGRAHV